MGPFDSDQQEMRVQSMYVPEGRVFLAKGAATANASGWEEPAVVKEEYPRACGWRGVGSSRRGPVEWRSKGPVGQALGSPNDGGSHRGWSRG